MKNSDDLDEALERARRHFANASREGAAAIRASVDVIQILAGEAGDRQRGTIHSDLTALLDRWLEQLEKERLDGKPSGWANPLFDSLAHETARWEAQAETDPAARPLVFALNGLKHLLGQLGIEPSPPQPGTQDRSHDPAQDPTRARSGPRVRAHPGAPRPPI